VAMLFSWLPGCKVIAPLLAAGGALCILIFHSALFYAPPFGVHKTVLTSGQDGTDLRATAKLLASIFPPGALIAEAASPGFFSATSWYLDQSSANPLTTQRLGPQDATVTLHFLAGHTYDTQEEDARPYIKSVMGDVGKVTQLPPAILYTFHVRREPIATIGSLPTTIAFSVRPDEFYRTVFQLENVRTVPKHQEFNPLYANIPGFSVSERGVVATKNNSPSFVEYVLQNDAGDKPMHIFTALHYFNAGKGSEISLFARFDDEQPLLVAKSAGPDDSRLLQVKVSRNAPFKRLAFFVRMQCNDATARYFGDNLGTLVFQGLDMRFVDPTIPSGPLEGGGPRVPAN